MFGTMCHLRPAPEELSGGIRRADAQELLLDTCERYKVTSVGISKDRASAFRTADPIVAAEVRP